MLSALTQGSSKAILDGISSYAGRPAIAESRLSLLPDGRVAYSLKKTWRDGSTHVVLEPQVLIERLLALGRARPQRVAWESVEQLPELPWCEAVDPGSASSWSRHDENLHTKGALLTCP